MIGEAQRADHFSLNGYKRETCPNLSKQNVISYNKIYSPWTHTGKSIPYILTRADSSNINPMFNEKSFISIFNKCGFRTYWLGNQAVGNTFAPFVANCDTVFINKPYHTSYNYKKKLDEELLPYFDNFLNEKKTLKLIILQFVGSHWFYPTYYTDDFEVYKPVIKGKTFNIDDKEKIINAYDNTIIYTDYILAKLIDRIKNEKSIMFYLSDHGELLGENGKWFHSQNTEYEKNPAFVLWFSDRYLKNYSIYRKNAEMNKFKHFNTSFLFHSILHSSQIKSPFLNEKYSIFSYE